VKGQNGAILTYRQRVEDTQNAVLLSIWRGTLEVSFSPSFNSLTHPYTLPNVWHFVGASYNSTSKIGELWFDGVMVASARIGNFDYDLGNVRVGIDSSPYGGDGSADDFEGRISRVRIYNVTLTQEQVQEIQAQVGKNIRRIPHFYY